MGTRRQFFTMGSSKDSVEFNVAILGALGVGKSALTVKYITKRFIMEYDPTLEDTYTKLETIDGQEISIRIMDTYDKEDNNPDRYLKWASGFLVVYSITNRPSFDKAKSYLETIAQYLRITGKDKPIALTGNKMDLERYRTVSKAAGQTLATQHDCSFYETSAAEDFDTVEVIFHDLIRDILRLNDRQMTLQPLFISEDKSGHLSPGSQALSRPAIRRTKSPKGSELKEKDRKEEKEPRTMQRRTVSTFKIFNKSFKIFN